MRTLSPDTSFEVERIHIELIRKASVFQRLQMVSSLVRTTRQLSWRGIRERYPYDPPELHIKRFISLLYKNERLTEKFVGSARKKEILSMKLANRLSDGD
jgi:hypothetical protein